MIGPGISAAQLDTIDVDAMEWCGQLAAAIDKMAEYCGIPRERVTWYTPGQPDMRASLARLGGRVSALSLAFVAIAQSAQKTGNTLELSVPAFEDVPTVPDFRQLANPRAPIPDRIRRRFDRGRGRR